RRDPAPHVHLVKGGPLANSPDWKAIRDELGTLVACYRTALADVVRVQEKLELLEATDSRGVAGPTDRNPQAGPQRYAGSSRHRLVARLAPNLHWIAAT